MATMNRFTFPADLQEGLNAHFGDQYRELPDEWSQVFDTYNSTKAYEEDVLNIGFGTAPVKAEGEGVAYDTGAQGWFSRYTHETIALAFAITEEAIEDNLYMSIGPKYAKALARALKQTKEIKGAAVLNNAFDANYPGGDGVALLSASHPLHFGGTFSNILATPADFSEQALEDILIQIRKAKDDRGIPIALSPKRIIIPPELEFVAERILRSPGRPGTPDNDINAIRSKGIFGSDPAIITRLVDADAWYIKTDAPEGLKHFKRTSVQRGIETDFSTGDTRYKVRERYSFGWSEIRSIFGSAGA